MDKHTNLDEYLGDGVYASYDGYHIILDLRAQNPAIRIALEPPVMEALKRYQESLPARLKTHEPHP